MFGRGLYLSIYVPVCMYVCIYVCMFVCMHTRTVVYVCVWEGVIFIYVCMYVCMYVYLHAHRHRLLGVCDASTFYSDHSLCIADKSHFGKRCVKALLYIPVLDKSALDVYRL